MTPNQRAQGHMRLTEKETETPSGLSRFLYSHESCPRGLEVVRDGDLVTVICRGCESSFAYVTASAPHEPTEVDRALGRLAGSDGTADDDGGAEPAGPAPDPPELRSTSRPRGGASRLPPPGPLAPRRRRKGGSGPGQLLSRVRAYARAVLRGVARRRRPIAMAALALTGAYVLVALGADSEPSSSDSGTPPGGTNLPLEISPPTAGSAPSAPLAENARTLESAEEGGPDTKPFTEPAGRFQLTLPADWGEGTTERGSARFAAPGGDAEVLVRVQPANPEGVGELADEAARILAARGSRVERIPSRSEGDLLAVARTKGGGEAATAYIAEEGGFDYLVISSRSSSASALVRLQADGVVRSFSALLGA